MRRMIRYILITTFSLISASLSAQKYASAAKDRLLTPDGHMYLGVDYYPEHWPKDRWETDLTLMRQAGFNVVRLAEFSWVLMEPSEGQYEFGWLDEFLALLPKYNIRAILGTPTASMPAWVARKYPEVLVQKEDGSHMRWGSRQENNLTSGAFRLLAEGITRAMGEHYKNHPSVIGWQIDNELWSYYDYSDITRHAFQDWLRQKYTSLDVLNKAWGTHFWGHKIQDWAEVTIPDCEGAALWEVRGNPSACLDWSRFHSWVNVQFLNNQASILKSIVSKDHFITHNLMAFSFPVDYFDLSKQLDFVSLDNYPVWYGPEVNYGSALTADLMRGLKQRNFYIMEQTAGPAGWGYFYRNPRPGEIRLIAYQMMAHGADGQQWFRWRTATAGREQYWHGLLGHDGKPLRRYEEVKKTVEEFRKLEKHVIGTTVKADVAIIQDYTSIWSLKSQPGYEGNRYEAAMMRYYNAFYRAGINTDIISPDADLSKYRLVIAPDMVIMPDLLARRLNDYVANGGVLLADCRTGVMDETNLAHSRTLPGLLSESLGIEIPEYEAITSDLTYRITSSSLFKDTLTAHFYCDWIVPTSATSVVGYDQWHLKAFSAVTRNQHQKGIGWYVGTVVKEESFYDRLIAGLLKDARLTPSWELPYGVEASVREGNGKKILFLMNHTEEKKKVNVGPGKTNLLTGKTDTVVELDKFEVAVIGL